jgi:hypothetical protein
MKMAVRLQHITTTHHNTKNNLLNVLCGVKRGVVRVTVRQIRHVDAGNVAKVSVNSEIGV